MALVFVFVAEYVSRRDAGTLRAMARDRRRAAEAMEAGGAWTAAVAAEYRRHREAGTLAEMARDRRLAAEAMGCRPWPPYEEARARARAAGRTSSRDYERWAPGEPDMPARPDRVYRGAGWTTWPDFLGTGFPSYEEARARARAAGVRTARDYERWARRVPGMPHHPDDMCRGAGWTTWPDFLGTGFPSYEEARARARAAGRTSRRDYARWARGVPDMPACPDSAYRGAGWTTWPDYLATRGGEE